MLEHTRASRSRQGIAFSNPRPAVCGTPAGPIKIISLRGGDENTHRQKRREVCSGERERDGSRDGEGK